MLTLCQLFIYLGKPTNMRLLALFAFLLLNILSANAQTKDEVLAEGWLMYHSERASWHGTDIFMAKFPEKRESIGGYFSYTDNKSHKCVFFDKEVNPGVLATITFDDSFVVEVADINTDVRKLNEYEKDLYTIRKVALAEVSKDTLFKHYERTSLNFIPMIVKGKKKVYLLTGPSESGVVIFGNDYLITFDKKNNITSKKVLHKNIIPITYGEKEDNSTTMHTHLESSGDLITATDICTLLLYGPYASWNKHMVISRKNVSIWSCKTEELFVMTREAWDKINEDGKKRDKE